MIAPDKHGQGCVRGTPEELAAIQKRRAFESAWQACRKSGAPRLIPWLWRAGLLFLLVAGALMLHAAFTMGAGVNLIVAWAGLGIGLIGPLALRVSCELAMTIFDFRDYLSMTGGEWT